MKKETIICSVIFLVIVFFIGCPNPIVYDWDRNGIDDRGEFFTIENTQQLRFLINYYCWGDNSEESQQREEVFNQLNYSIGYNMWTFEDLFSGQSNFNSDIGDWNTTYIENMSGLFRGTSSFNQNISEWNVSNVEDMSEMFNEATSFNQDISKWDVANVKNMYDMFRGATSFNQDISGWDVSSVSNFGGMFAKENFMQGHEEPDDMIFYQDLSSWDVTGKSTYHMFYNTPMESKLEWHPQGCQCGATGH